MKRIFNKNSIYPLILVLLSGFIAASNYTGGTILSGWDTLHPEFNFLLNIERTFFGVFRPEQGLGAVAGHSHMADLPRIIFLFLSSFILPTDFLRYFYVFLMLIIGPLGMYLFLYKTLLKEKTTSFLGALFYLLNIGTVQIFFVPFEMFVTQYGFLPWLFLFATQYLKSKKSNKYLLFFALATLLSTPIAYAATLWYAQFAFLFSYIVLFAILSRKDHKIKQKAVALLAVTLAINSFWILPNIYYLLNFGKSLTEANINKLFSPQAFLYNKQFGELKDVILMKNFLFDWNVYEGHGSFAKLLEVWIERFRNPYILLAGIIFSGMAVFGSLTGFLKKKAIIISLLPGVSFCLFLLINDNFPTGFIYTFLQESIPFFEETLRFPHNKVAGLFIFCFTVFLAYCLTTFKEIFRHIKAFTAIQTVVVTLVLLWFMLPMFSGNLISPTMRVQIPREYFSLFDYFNKQSDDRRIANLPIHSFWGWEYYDWYENKAPSFQGAGFIWFGIKQPLLARDFDRWTPYNEQYYREMSYAIYSENAELLSSVIRKYDIGYILMDKSVIAPQSQPNVLFHAETDILLSQLVKNGTLEEPIKFGRLSVYKTRVDNAAIKFNLLSKNSPNLYEDFAYTKFGNYVEAPQGNDLSLIDNSSFLKSNLFELTDKGLLFKERAPSLDLPSFLLAEKNISAEVVAQRKDSNEIQISFYPDTFTESKKSVPIIAEVNLQNRNVEKTILSINQKDNFPLENLSGESPLILGRVFLSTEVENTISLYDDSQSTAIPADFSKINYTLSPCIAEGNDNTFGMDLDSNGSGFTIFGTNTSLCLTIPVSEISAANPTKNITKESLLGMSFDYSGNKNPEVCAVNLLSGGCIKNITPDTKIGERDINNLGIRITLNALRRSTPPSTPFGAILENPNQEEKASYKNVSFTTVKPFYSATLASDILTKSLEQSPKEKDSADTLFIPSVNSEEFRKDIVALTQPNNSCQNFEENVNKKTKKDGSIEYIEYSSKEGSLCDYFSYPNLAQNTAYAIVITARNVKGLPLNICISNPYSSRCDVYAALPKDKEKIQTVLILPPMSANKFGITLDINNFAIRKTESVNELYEIKVIPFPYTWLTNLSSGEELKNNRIILSNYSFEKGWKAYEVKNLNFWTKNLPFIFGKEIKNHVKVNGWKNGWIASDTKNDSQIVITYLPQWLEYVGFALLLGTFGYLLFRHVKS